MDTKICEICNEIVDTRGYGNHLIACKRKQNQVNPEAKSLNRLQEEVKPSELEAKVSELEAKSSELEAKISEFEEKSSDLDTKVTDIETLHHEDLELLHQEQESPVINEDIEETFEEEIRGPEEANSDISNGLLGIIAALVIVFGLIYLVLRYLKGKAKDRLYKALTECSKSPSVCGLGD